MQLFTRIDDKDMELKELIRKSSVPWIEVYI